MVPCPLPAVLTCNSARLANKSWFRSRSLQLSFSICTRQPHGPFHDSCSDWAAHTHLCQLRLQIAIWAVPAQHGRERCDGKSLQPRTQRCCRRGTPRIFGRPKIIPDFLGEHGVGLRSTPRVRRGRCVLLRCLADLRNGRPLLNRSCPLGRSTHTPIRPSHFTEIENCKPLPRARVKPFRRFRRATRW
jgi:hypothetical protein